MAADTNESGLRYSTFDLVFFVVLAAAQCYLFVEYIGMRVPVQNRVAAVLSAGAIGLGIAFGAGLLACLRWTKRKTESWFARSATLVFVTGVTYAIVFGFGIFILLLR